MWSGGFFCCSNMGPTKTETYKHKLSITYKNNSTCHQLWHIVVNLPFWICRLGIGECLLVDWLIGRKRPELSTEVCNKVPSDQGGQPPCKWQQLFLCCVRLSKLKRISAPIREKTEKMVFVIVSFPNGIIRVIPEVPENTRMHTISKRIHAHRGLLAVK